MALLALAGIAGKLVKKAAGFPKRQARKEAKKAIARDTIGIGIKAGPLTGGLGFTYPSGSGRGSTTSASGCSTKKKHRSMNVTNPRALSRALRRMEGFERLAKRYLRVQHAGTPHGFKRVSKRRKR